MQVSRSSLDPRLAPLLGRDTHLPPVAPAAQTPTAIQERFLHQSALQWEPELRGEPLFVAPRNARPAAVLVPLVQRQEGLSVLLTQRSSDLRHHPGQISLPGGRCDPQDITPIATALREANEEVALQEQYTQVLGSLPIFATGSAFVVTPVVALVQPHEFSPNPGEVEEVFEVPLDFVLNPANHQHHSMFWQGQKRHWLAMPYDQRFIWGATAAILRNFYSFMRAPMPSMPEKDQL